MSFYTFCPKCGSRHRLDRPYQAEKGIDCGDCGEKFWPEKLERESDSGKSWSTSGICIAVAGLVAILIWSYLFFSQAPNDPPPGPAWLDLGVGACAAGFWCLLMGQLFHIRTALEKLNSKK